MHVLSELISCLIQHWLYNLHEKTKINSSYLYIAKFLLYHIQQYMAIKILHIFGRSITSSNSMDADKMASVYVMHSRGGSNPRCLKDIVNRQTAQHVHTFTFRKTRGSDKNQSKTFLWYDMDCIQKDASNTSFTVACVFISAVTFLLSRCLAMVEKYTHRCTDDGRD
jgi:hypothetical protein